MADSRILLSKEEAKRKKEEKEAAIGIIFFNKKTGATYTATTVEHIAAFFNSSDQGPNSKNHQDMGWRLAPEDLVELEDLKANPEVMEKIAAANQLPPDEVPDYNVLKYMANKRFAAARKKQEAESGNFEQEYEERVQELRKKKSAPKAEEKVEKPTKKADNGDNDKQ